MERTIKVKCSASCGDIVYSLIAVKQLSKKHNAKVTYYIHHNDGHYSKHRSVNTYEQLKRLLEYQDYISECLPYTGGQLDYDLDKFRRVPLPFATTPLPWKFLDAVGLERFHGWDAPWLKPMQTHFFHGKKVLNVTTRYQNYSVDFRTLCNVKDTIFIGLENEHKRYPEFEAWVHNDLYDIATTLAGAKALYCNQSVLLTLAQGLGITSYLAKDNKFNNTLVGHKTTVL